MLSDSDVQGLFRELDNPWSWHWKVEHGFFVKKAEPIESMHVHDILEGLDKSSEPGAREQAQLIRKYLVALHQRFVSQGHREAAGAVGLLNQSETKPEDSGAGFSAVDLPLDEYTDLSYKGLVFPEAVDFALSSGGVLESAREVAVYRMAKGASDLIYYYSTRTAAIYFKEGNEYFVCFDDDPLYNILLLRAEEGKSAGDRWLVSRSDPLISGAISRAKSSGRVVRVTNGQERGDAVFVAKAIIGNKAEEYDTFLKNAKGRPLRVWTLNNNNCRIIEKEKALIRFVGFGVDIDYDYLGAVDRLDIIWRAGGVQKISTGNRGPLVPYVGLRCFIKLGKGDDVSGMLSYFGDIEKGISGKKKSLFYGGLYSVMQSINSVEDIDSYVLFFKKHAGHEKWFKRPLLVKYAFEIFKNDKEEQQTSLLERMSGRRKSNFKMKFLRKAYEQQFNDEISEEDIENSPSSSIVKIIEGAGISQQDIVRARAAINTTKKGLYFPLNKTYYKQSAKGIKVEKMALDIVKQAVLDVISITATPTTRWQEKHDKAKERIAQLLSNPAKAQELAYFFQSCINQLNYYKFISSQHKKLQSQADKETIVETITVIKNAAQQNKNKAVTEQQYNQKMEPLNDILTMLKSQTDDTATEVNGVTIKTQKPSITDLVDYDTTNCCALFPYNNKDGAIGYLEDEHIILLQYFTTGKKGLLTIYGAIICALCEDNSGNTILLVDSAEGDENWLKAMKNWQATYHNCIKELAKDAKAKAVFYGNNAGNTVPKKFLEYIKEKIPPPNNPLNLKKKNPTPRYLESLSNGWSGTAKGYYEEV
ncbi:MAG: hypothetical protein V1659_00340 [Candidatus Woesearchaeota archaeon]